MKKEVREKGNKASAKARAMKVKIQRLLKTGQIDDLMRKTLENWAEMIDSKNENQRAFATKEVSKYLFATKREHQAVPNVKINCSFIGIKDDLEEKEIE